MKSSKSGTLYPLNSVSNLWHYQTLGTTQTLGSLLYFKTDFSVSVHLLFISAGYKHVPTDGSLVCLTFLEPPFTQVTMIPLYTRPLDICPRIFPGSYSSVHYILVTRNKTENSPQGSEGPKITEKKHETSESAIKNIRCWRRKKMLGNIL